MSALGLILARGGSKGVPGKNTADVAGRPCLAWTVDDALSGERLTRVALSSDDPVALDIARKMGVETVERPSTLATDGARVDDAARHAVGALGWEQGDGGPVVILYANVPVRPAGLLDGALDRLEDGGFDSVQSYAAVGKHHPWWTARLDEGGAVEPWEGEVLNHGVYRRQELPPAFVPDGGVLAVTPDALMLRIPGAGEGPHAFFGRRRGGIETGEGAVIDIDSKIDLLVADAALREREGVAPTGRWRRTG